MLFALLILAGLNLGILVTVAWVILRSGEEEVETNAVGFRFEPQQEEDEDVC